MCGNPWAVRYFIAAVLLSTASSAYAASGRHEVTAGGGTLVFGGSATAIELVAGYKFTIFNFLQIGGDVGFNTASHQDISVTAISLLAGPTLNIGDISNATFMTLGLAFRTSSGSSGAASTTSSSTSTTATASTSTTSSGTTTTTTVPAADPSGVGFGAAFGKRFTISSSVCYRPTIGFYNTGTFSFYIQPVLFSMMF
jgi:hypothetical protein